MNTSKKILLSGATGYVGRKLLVRLEHMGYAVNCLTRRPYDLQQLGRKTEVCLGDALLRSSMWKAFRGVHTAFYLIHSLHEQGNFEDKELKAAENFAIMARQAGVQRIIYLGALGSHVDALSPHLQSRHDVGFALRNHGVNTIELQSSIVIGAGSSSFDLLADLTEHLPLMITPKWVSTLTQPIAIDDLLNYLVQAIDLPGHRSQIIQIGGRDRISYGGLMKKYAELKGLKRIMIPTPVLSPGLSSHWISIFSRVDPVVGRRLIHGIRNSTVVDDERAGTIFNVKPMSIEQALQNAIEDQAWTEFKREQKNVYIA